MFKVRSLKALAIVEVVFAFISWGIAIGMIAVSRSLQESSEYYWYREVRSVATIFSVLSFISFMIGAVELGLGIRAVLLKKTGKVCPQCERVHYSMVVKCPKCGADMTYAKMVDEYLSENPVVAAGAPSVVNSSSTGGGNGTKNTSKRFCGKCGHEMKSETAFCPYCGEKQ